VPVWRPSSVLLRRCWIRGAPQGRPHPHSFSYDPCCAQGGRLLNRFLFAALPWVWGCNDEDACLKKSGQEADLCWADLADELSESNPTRAVELAGRIEDGRIRDISMLALAGQFLEPRERLAACWEIHDSKVRDKCLTFQRRAHLWTAPGTEPTATSTPTQRPNRKECGALPEHLRDACELQSVLSAVDFSLETDQAPLADDSQCLAISDPEARALCQTEIAERLSRAGGLRAGVSACERIENPPLKDDCFLRVRSVHPEAPIEQQMEVCRLSGDFLAPCVSMIRISVGAVLAEHHRDKPAQEALDEIDRQIREHALALVTPEIYVDAGFLARDLWYRTFARLLRPSGPLRTWSTEDLSRWVPILDQLKPDDPRQAMLRASLMRAFSVIACRGSSRLLSEPTETAQPLDGCSQTSRLKEHFGLWLAQVRETVLEIPASLGPPSPDPLQLGDWWTVYRSDVGVIPLPFQLGCAMTQSQGDEVAAMWGLSSRGEWVRRKEAFRTALQSSNPALRMFAVNRLHQRLSREGPFLAERDVTMANLKAWTDMDSGMRALLQTLLSAIERGDTKPPSSIRTRICPGKDWPVDPNAPASGASGPR